MLRDMDALTQAINAAGGVGKLAGALKARQSVVSNWKARGQVPADKCPAIEAVTGVRCEDLRGDLTWQRDLSGRVIGFVTLTPDQAA